MTQTAAQSALFIAARLGRIWGDIPPNDMARLLFLAQSWHLLSNGEPLFKDVIYAGYQGPVIKGLGHLPDLPRSVFDQTMALPYHLYVISTQVPGMPLSPALVLGQPPWIMKPLMMR